MAKGGDAVELLRTLSTDSLRKHDLETYLHGLEFIDFLHNHPSIPWTPEEFVKTLRKLQPRLYSIASSRKHVGEAVHLTIATVRYQTHGRKRHGVASSFLADRTAERRHRAGLRAHGEPFPPAGRPGDATSSWSAPAPAWRPSAPTCRSGGRSARPGKNWLFFGEQRRASRFPLRGGARRAGSRTARSTSSISPFRATCRARKSTCSTRCGSTGARLYDWLEGGAHFFVCGDGARMAKDVDAELHAIAEQQGGKTPEQAAEWVEALKKDEALQARRVLRRGSLSNLRQNQRQ